MDKKYTDFLEKLDEVFTILFKVFTFTFFLFWTFITSIYRLIKTPKFPTQKQIDLDHGLPTPTEVPPMPEVILTPDQRDAMRWRRFAQDGCIARLPMQLSKEGKWVVFANIDTYFDSANEAIDSVLDK